MQTTGDPPLQLTDLLGDLRLAFIRRGEWIDNLLEQRNRLRRVVEHAHKNGLRVHDYETLRELNRLLSEMAGEALAQTETDGLPLKKDDDDEKETKRKEAIGAD